MILEEVTLVVEETPLVMEEKHLVLKKHFRKNLMLVKKNFWSFKILIRQVQRVAVIGQNDDLSKLMSYSSESKCSLYGLFSSSARRAHVTYNMINTPSQSTI